ncbi:alpha/beta-hydrolase [Jackrogersella minutella]|nr:alpha/beta-hydrolase [Jackrogersella minutella]
MRNSTWLRAAFFGLVVGIVVASNPIVKFEERKITYRGVPRCSVEEDFGNIRFAHDTSGLRRFAPPEPYTPPEGTEIEATAPGPACPQPTVGIPPFFVTKPMGTTPCDELPVVIHVIGGGVIKASPVIHVTFNYSLYIYLDRNSLDVGMRDQRAGSQTPGTALNITSDATEIHTRAVAEPLGCGNNEDENKILECLRDIPMEKLIEAAMAYSVNNHPPAGLFTFIPFVDDDFLPGSQRALHKAGKFVKGVPIVFGWTHDDGATNAGPGPAPTFQTEEDMKIPIKNFARALTDDDYEQLFALYPASNFEQEAHDYQAKKSESDPIAPIHYFRVARILRDLLFTCSSIYFSFKVSRQSKALNPTFTRARHYDLHGNALFHVAGMPYLRAIHGSDLDYIYTNMVSRDQISEYDRELSYFIRAAFISFAYTRNPSDSSSQKWSETFSDHAEFASSPTAINLQLIGGPLGTGSCHLVNDKDGNAGFSVLGNNMQSPLVNSTQLGEMESPVSQERQRELQRDRLFDRCAFIDSLAERLGH